MKVTFVEGTQLNHGEWFWEWNDPEKDLSVPRIGDLIRHDLHTYEVRKVLWIVDSQEVQVYCVDLAKEKQQAKRNRELADVGKPGSRG